MSRRPKDSTTTVEFEICLSVDYANCSEVEAIAGESDVMMFAVAKMPLQDFEQTMNEFRRCG